MLHTATLFDPAALAEVRARLAALTPDAERQWGTMSVGKMLCHCSDQLRLALGDLPPTAPTGPMTWAPVRWLIIHVVPWPHGVMTASEMLTTDPESFSADRDALLGCIDRFAARGPHADFAPHPLFGHLSGIHWGRLAHRHLDHHLRQFSA